MSSFTKPSTVPAASLVKSSHINNLSDATAAAFNVLPDEIRLQQGRATTCTVGGSANTITLALPKTATSLLDGLEVNFIPTATNTGAVTVNVDSLGAIPVKDASDSALSANAIISGVPISLRYSASKAAFYLIGANASYVSSAAASATSAANSAAVASGIVSGIIPGSGNKVINGDLAVNQLGFTSTTTSSDYTFDCFQVYSSHPAKTWSAVAGFAGFKNALRTQRNAGSSSTTTMYLPAYTMDTLTSLQLAGKQVVVSFYIKPGAGFTSSGIVATLFYGTGTDQNILTGFTGQANAGLLSIPAPTPGVEQRAWFATTVPANATQLGFYGVYNPVGTAGAADYLDFTGLDIREGSILTPFDHIFYDDNLRHCKRRLNVINSYVPAYPVRNQIPIYMRATPTVTGGGAGFSSAYTTADVLVVSQTAEANQTLILTANL